MRENWDTSKNVDLLFKYRPFDPKHDEVCERTLRMLRERMVWMASPNSFNDPFDCRPSILRDTDAEQKARKAIVRNRLKIIKRALRTGAQLADMRLEPIPRRELVELRRFLESPLSEEEKYDKLQKHFPEPPDGHVVFRVLEDRLISVGVLSLSATATEILMWAHYASQHTGFCLGFERSEGSLLEDSRHTKPVQYLDAYPKVDLNTMEVSWSVSVGDQAVSSGAEVDIEEPHLQAAIYSKYKGWEYEKEWRVLVPAGGQLAPYPGPLRKIIFGLRCAQESRQRIQGAAMEGMEERIQFGEIESVPGSFALNIRDVGSDSSAPDTKKHKTAPLRMK